jgi:transposase-like protein
MFAAEVHQRRVAQMRGYPQWRWHLDEVFVKVNGKLRYLRRASIMKATCWRRSSPQNDARPQR